MFSGYTRFHKLAAQLLKGCTIFFSPWLRLKKHNGTDGVPRFGAFHVRQLFQFAAQIDGVGNYVSLTFLIVNDDRQLHHVFTFELHSIHK